MNSGGVAEIAFLRSFVGLSLQKFIYMMKCHRSIRVFPLLSLLLLLSACQPETDHTAVYPPDEHKNKPLYKNEEAHANPKQIPQEKERLETVIGWLGSDKILYSAIPNGNDSPQVMLFNRETGKAEIFYQPGAPVVNVSISPRGDYVAIHTSSTANKATIDLVKSDGTKEYSAAIPSKELDFSWNPYDNGVLFLTSFFEDWSFTSYIVDAKKKTITALDFPQPFAQWEEQERLLYLDWNRNDPKLQAPLISMNINDRSKETVMLDVFHFQKMKQGLMAIQIKSEKTNEAVYKFFNGKNKQISSFTAQRLPSFSDPVIPHFSFNEKTSSFYTFIPDRVLKEGKYEGRYKLIKFNYKTGNITEVLNEAENSPINCSPEGSWCLYGNQQEKIINVKEKKVYSLVEAMKK